MTPRAKTFLLVHGSWLGGWCWRRVENQLRAAGHRVYAPTMTGVGDRSHMLSHNITPDTWVKDVEQVLKTEELTDVVIVGHSFGGRVVTGVVDRNPRLIERVVFLDSAPPETGKSLLDQMPEAARAARAAAAAPSGGLSIPPPTALHLGVQDPCDQAWLDRRMTAQPFGTHAMPLSFHNPIGNRRPVSFIEFTDPVFPYSELAARFARAQPDWDVRSLATGHMAMITEPEKLTAMLLEIAE